MTSEEFDSIVFKVTEAVLLRMPEVMGNLIKEHAVANKLNKVFYDKHPEFRDKAGIVKSVIEQVESENTALEYEDILNKSVPLINERITQVLSADTENKPQVGSLDFNTNGVL